MVKIRVSRVASVGDISDAQAVLNEVYVGEKRWIRDAAGQISGEILPESKCSWFIARHRGKPAGVLRLLYDPELHFPDNIGLKLKEGVDLDKLRKESRIVEVGRFCILPEYRTSFLVAIRLMKGAIREVVERGYTHFITDVFENEPTSPYKFHTRILGFEVIGTHLYGELNCSCTRIIMTLDILKAYKTMKERRSRIYNSLTYGIRTLLNSRLKAMERK